MAYPAAAVAALILLGAGVGGALFANGRMAYDAWPQAPAPDHPKRVEPVRGLLAPAPRAGAPRAPARPRPRAPRGVALRLPAPAAPPAGGPPEPPARPRRRSPARPRPAPRPPAPPATPAPPVQPAPPTSAPAPEKPVKDKKKGQAEGGPKPKKKPKRNG
jgi:hypothetical protein